MPRKAIQTTKGTYHDVLSKDTGLKKILADAPVYTLKPKENLPLFLYSTIINQQLSDKVGRVLYGRFLELYGGREPASQQVLSTPPEVLRGIGISLSKASFIHNVARFDTEQGLNAAHLDTMDDDEVIRFITSIKGIGRWTAHILLISALGREDVFPADDLIIQKTMAAIYGLDRSDRKKFMADIHRIAGNWSPYRTYACLHLWNWNDNPQK